MKAPLVSIIIPVYNAGKYLEETLQSARAQTWANKEIIIVNDGSTDNSLKTAYRYADSTTRVFTQENKGAAAARNYGLREAKGEYIQFLDADDLLSPNKIETQMELLINYPGHVGLCATVHFRDNTDPLTYSVMLEWFTDGSNNPADFLIKLYGGDLIGPMYGGMIQPNAWLTPRHLIEKAGFWNETKSPDDDGEFFCRVILASKGVKYAFTGVNYYRKFVNNKSWSAQKDYEACKSLLKGTDLKSRHLLSNTDDERAKLALSRLYWDNAFSFYPRHIDLAREAESKAKALAPDLDYRVFKNYVAQKLSKLIGWKAVRYLQYKKSDLF